MHPGHGRWGETGDGDPRRAWIAEAHRRLHEDEARADGGSASPGSPATPGTTAG